MHILRPVVDAYEPAVHGRHALLSLWPKKWLLVPVGQAEHVSIEIAPLFELKVPAGHGVKTSASELAEALGQEPPDGQLEQAVLP